MRAATDAAGDQSYPGGALYVVATPIGNRADLTLRAIHVLGLVDAIACEDTRHSAPLLRQLGITKPLIALHRHNEHEAAGAVLRRLAQGERVACVSDAGTPAVSDPGAVLVAAAHAAGHRVVPVPGPSSAIAALSVAGDTAPGGFAFLGFLPARGPERAQALAALAANPASLVLFEAPHRIATLLRELAETVPARRLTLCREMTKQFEGVETLPASAAPAWLQADPHRERGEFVLVLHGVSTAEVAAVQPRHDAALRALLLAMPLKQAVAVAAELSGAPRNALYRRALELKDADGDDEAPPRSTPADDER